MNKPVHIKPTKDKDLGCNTCRREGYEIFDLRFGTSGGTTVLRQCYVCLTQLKNEATNALF